MRGMQGTRRMFTMISGNVLEDSRECSHFSIPGNAREDSGECSRRIQGMFQKILGMFKKIPVMLWKIRGNAIKDSGECSRRFRGMFKKIAGNVFNFNLIKTTFYLKKQMLSKFRRREIIFATSNETIKRSNKMVWYFHLFWNSNWKEIARPWEKTKKEKLKTKTNRRRKWIKEIKVRHGVK